MKRRTFIRTSLSAAAVPLMAGGLSLQGCARLRGGQSDRILVLIQLVGGNDGLNTIIPVDQYSCLSAARKNLLIPEKKILPLRHTSVTGLHPAMPELREMYDSGSVAVVQGVGYRDPVFSHFRAMDIWHSGSGADHVLDSGWIGRLLEKKYPGYPTGYPRSDHPSPPAVQIGTVLNPVLQGPYGGTGITVDSADHFYDMTLSESEAAIGTPCGYELSYISRTAMQTKEYTVGVKKALTAQQNRSPSYPAVGSNPLADQLRIVARLIGGGLGANVYMVSLNDFDTHHSQAGSDPVKGTHANLLSQLSVAIAAFDDDIRRMGRADDVLGMTYSEFGRRIMENASGGTDHGSSGPVILFGSKLKGGLIGQNPIIPGKVTVEDNLAIQHDYRSVYASVIKGWFGRSAQDTTSVLMGKYPDLDIFA